MAVDNFIKIDGIKGESADKGHKDQIDILSWSWGASNGGTTHQGGGGGSGKCNVQDLSLTKPVDKSSMELLKACITGKHIASATLYLRKAGGKAEEYFSVKMEEILVTSFQLGGAGSDHVSESLTLNFAKFTAEYKGQKADGSLESAGVKCIWNIASNADT